MLLSYGILRVRVALLSPHPTSTNLTRPHPTSPTYPQNRSFDECLAGVAAALLAMSAPDEGATDKMAKVQVHKRINGHVVRLTPLIKTLLQNQANQVGDQGRCLPNP